MKQQTRDNLIYLAVGLGIAALLVADLFYTDSRGREMWIPSKFAIRAVMSALVLPYYLIKMMRADKATPGQIIAAVLLACAAHLGIIFAFRQAVGQLAGIGFCALAVPEMFFVGVLSEQAVLYILPRRRDA